MVCDSQIGLNATLMLKVREGAVFGVCICTQASVK